MFFPLSVYFRRYRMPALLLLLSAASASGEVCPEADSVALSWLDKMSRSTQHTSYHGVVTLQRGNDMQVLQFSHLVDRDSSSERLTELTGDGAQVERGAHSLDCVHPGQQMLRLGEALQAGRCDIVQQYRFSLTEGEQVAGRNAVRIRIEPRDMYRFGYVMALDAETGLLLKTEIIGRGRKILETVQFADLSYSAAVPAASEVDVIHEAQHPDLDRPSISATVSRAWAVSWLPRGFKPTDNAFGTSARRTYTDGLAVFSVFLENLDREISAGEGVVRLGGTTSYTRGMRLSGEPVLVTVVGEVPVNTARMVVDSIGWVR